MASLVLLLIALPLAAQAKPQPTITLTEPPPPLLPANAQFVDDPAAPGLPRDTPEVHTILTEDGAVGDAARTLHDAGGAATGWMRAYRFGDATGAYAAYTYFRQGARIAAPEKLNASDVVTPGGERVMLSGVTVLCSHGIPASLLRQVETGLPKVSGRAGLAPLLPHYLPPIGLDRSSIRYTLGPAAYGKTGGILPAGVIDWTKSTEAITADYAGKGALTLLLYPTPEVAGAQGRAIQDAINVAGPSHFGTVRMKRVGPLVAITSGGFPVARAQALIDSVRLDQVVTFDEKMPLQFHTEVRKTASLLENIALLSGILVLAAVLLALFLGGARAGIRVLQGKPAASEPEFLTIALRERPKGLFSEPAKRPES